MSAPPAASPGGHIQQAPRSGARKIHCEVVVNVCQKGGDGSLGYSAFMIFWAWIGFNNGFGANSS